jgi:hypothetical protein
LSRNILPALTLAGLMVLFMACFKNARQSSSGNQAAQAGLFIIHASADAPPVDIYANSKQINNIQFVYLDNSEGYLTLNPNNYSFNFTVSGTQNSLASQSDSLGLFKQYSLILYDSLPNPKLMCIRDNFNNASTSNSNWRFLDLSPDIAVMNLYVDNAAVLPSRSFADNIANPALDTFMQVAAGSHQITLTYLSGHDTLRSMMTLDFVAGKVFTVFASGFGYRTDTTKLSLNAAENY